MAYVVFNAAGSPALLSIVGAHLVFNLREAAEKGINHESIYGTNTASNIDFAPHSSTAAGIQTQEQGSGIAAVQGEEVC